jgi:ABC-type lipoprotein export system ATPase subunit
MDIVVVTHNPTLVESADRAFRIRKNEGRATFHEIRRS